MPSKEVAVTGSVYRLSEGAASPDPINLYARVGDTVGQSLTIENTASADGYSENLDASATASGDASVTGGTVLALAAGSSDSSTINVSADSTTADVFSGQVDVAFESNGDEWGLGSNVDLGDMFEDILGVQNAATGPAHLLAGTFSSLSNYAIFCLNGMTISLSIPSP